VTACRVVTILFLELTLKRVPLEKKIKIDINKDKYNVEEVMDLQKGKNIFKYLVK